MLPQHVKLVLQLRDRLLEVELMFHPSQGKDSLPFKQSASRTRDGRRNRLSKRHDVFAHCGPGIARSGAPARHLLGAPRAGAGRDPHRLFPLLANVHTPRQLLAKVIFGGMGSLALLYCLASGRRSTADCLSEEKREGTLGLLFLTDLTGYDVVLGKLSATSVNAFYGFWRCCPCWLSRC